MGGFLVGVFAGRTILDVVFSRSVMLALAWMLIPWAAASAAIGVFHAPAAGYVAGIVALVAAVLFATTPPLGRLRLALLEGMMIWCGLTMLVAIARVAIIVAGSVVAAIGAFIAHDG